jgi:hypothetical protein
MSFGDEVGVPTDAVVMSVRGSGNGGPRALIYRAHPDYHFVSFDRLSAREANALADLRRDPNYCGVLQPDPATGLTIKAVCPETARLFELLQEPGPLPPYISDDPDSALAIARLISDGILQIKQDSEWICGPAVHPTDEDAFPDFFVSRGVVASLSLRAIQHAAALATADAQELASSLFRYNSLPLTSEWLRRIPDRGALERYLQIQTGGQCRAQLDSNWVPVEAKTDRDPWLAWTSCTVPRPPKNWRTYKLYISPHPAHIGSVFPACLDAITRASAFHWKIGSNIGGLLRPDKLVAYFSHHDALLRCSEIIGKQLTGCPAQGVPLTAELGYGALLSWGSDPLEEEMVPDWLKRQSWRQSICLRLGSFLAVAKREKMAAIPPWRFAMERLHADGIDVDTWTLSSAAQPAETGKVSQR